MASPSPTGRLLRIIIPLLGVGLAIAAAVATLSNTRRQGTTPTTTPAVNPSATPPAAASATPTAPAAAGGTPTTPGAPGTVAPAGAQEAAAAPSGPVLSLAGLRARPVETAGYSAIGSVDAGTSQTMKVAFSPVGAGVQTLDLAAYFATTRRTEHVRLQETHTHAVALADGTTSTAYMTPLAAFAVDVAPVGRAAVGVDLTGVVNASGSDTRVVPVWREASPGVFEAEIVNESGEVVLRVRREFRISPGSYVIRLVQRVENLSGQALVLRWHQLAGVDLPAPKQTYGGDKRRVRFGYQLSPQSQGSDPTVLSQKFLWYRNASEVLGKREASGLYAGAHQVWPNAASTDQGLRLSWAAMAGQYFGVAAFGTHDPASADKSWPLAESVYRLLLRPELDPTRLNEPGNVMGLYVTSVAVPTAIGGSADFSMNVFAGPMDRRAVRGDAVASGAGLDGLIVYNLGGMCGPCTFELLTGMLIGLLRVVHDYLVFDWALAIMVLVLVVRTILHPVTKWSQIRIQRFGKQMADMAPKQKKLQEKYAGDPQKLREETARLWREEGVNPAGALGCIPMFLQTPVWIALFATLTFAIELRHEAAFFGVFQALSGGRWSFLADLAEPDHLIEFGRSFHVPLLSPLMGDISGLNVLPLVLGVVFFIQQKYLTPPTSAPLTPEQEMQQKMIKFMMVVMFPLFMYNAPSGLAIYFITNSVLGILESRWIRAHIEKNKLLEVKRPAGGRETFMQRLQRMAEERQRAAMKAKGMPPPAKRRDPRG